MVMRMPYQDDHVEEIPVSIVKDWNHRKIQQLHDTQMAGHLGVAKTLSRVRERFYWVQCRRDVQEWCHNCDAQKRGPQKKIKAPMAQYNTGSPMERIAIDVLGPLPITETGKPPQ